MKEIHPAHDPHPLAPDDPGIPSLEEYGLGSRYVNAMFALALKKAGHITEVPAEVFIDARLSRQAIVAQRGRR